MIGFIEGEGSFVVAERGDLSFVITQSVLNIGVLYIIKWTLGFGSVIKQGANTFRFVVQDEAGLKLIILLCYRNLCITKRISQLIKFIHAYNVRYGAKLSIKSFTAIRPTWNDAWLVGYIDGEGCFNISWISTQSRFKISFSVSQSYSLDLLEYLIVLFGVGRIEGDNQFVFHCYDHFDHGRSHLIPYLERFPLKTTKLNSYCLWLTLIGMIERGYKIGNARFNSIIKL